MAEFKIETYRILNLTDWDDYTNLTGVPTKEYDLIMSLGTVDLSVGSLAQTKLWAMFPEGTTTGDNFRDVSNGCVVPPAVEE